jgi:Tfp pilus assembly protein PilO
MRLILSILMFIASIAGFVVFIVPTYKQVSALRAQSADYNQVLSNARTLQEERNKLVQKYNAFDPALLGKLNMMLPTNPENMKLILELNSIARQYGLALQNVKIEDSTNEVQNNAARPAGSAPVNTELGTLKITFGATGPYLGFTKFIKTVEQSLRIVDIDKVTFSAIDDTKQNYQYTVGVRTYWLK